MPVPLPTPDHANLEPPGAAEVALVSRGVIGAVAPPAEPPSSAQRLVVEAALRSMTGHLAPLDEPPLGAWELAEVLADRNYAYRARILQLMVLAALVLRPLPPGVVAQVERYARELSVDDEILKVAQRFAGGSLGLAAVEFERGGHTASWSAEHRSALHTSRELATAWQQAGADPDLAATWQLLEDLPEGTLGRRVSEYYRARGFVYPGQPGSAPVRLAQHDWVHVLADYGSTVESEIETFAFVARAADTPEALSLLAMAVSLLWTGHLDTTDVEVAGGLTTRLADAMRRGALCRGSVDFLDVDWFDLAPLPLDAVRMHFEVEPKSEAAIAAGSVGPWEAGGITSFQVASGRQAADRAGRPYDAYGASPWPEQP